MSLPSFQVFRLETWNHIHCAFNYHVVGSWGFFLWLHYIIFHHIISYHIISYQIISQQYPKSYSIFDRSIIPLYIYTYVLFISHDGVFYTYFFGATSWHGPPELPRGKPAPRHLPQPRAPAAPDAGAGAVGHVVAGGMGAGAESARKNGDLNSTRGTVGDEFVLC